MGDLGTTSTERLGGKKTTPNIIKNFAPSWHAAVMGTGALALAFYSYQRYIPALSVMGDVFFYLTGVMFILLFIPWILRWIICTKTAVADLRHPVMSNFYPTFTAGIVVLGMDFAIIGHNAEMGVILWLIGSLGTVVFAVITSYLMYTGSHVKLDHINPGFFIPPVALLVIPLGGAMLLPHVSHAMVNAVVVFNFFGFGAGFFLYLAFLAVMLHRLILHEPLPGALAATFWIKVGPLGAAAVALVNMAKYTPFISGKEPFFVGAFLLWGFGAWWLLMAGVMSIHYASRGKFAYGLSWWGFTFPTGAFVLASHAIATALSIPLLDAIGFGVLWLLAFLWLLTFIKTLQKTGNGSLFADPQKQSPRTGPAQ